MKSATGTDTSKFAKKIDLANSKSNVDESDVNKLRNVPTNLSNLKSKVEKLDLGKLVPVSVDLSEISHVVKNDVVKKNVYNAKMKNIEDEIPHVTNLVTNASLNAKINEVKDKIPNITNLAATTALTAVENRIPNISDLVKKMTIKQKLMKLKIKLLLIMITINILLLKNLISYDQKTLLQD